jgi:hypothetical protein
MPYDSPFSAVFDLLGGGGGSAVVPFQLTDTESTDATSGLLAVGQIDFDPSEYVGATTFEFFATFSVTSGALTGSVALYNVTDAEVVTGTLFTGSNTTPARQGSGPLTVGPLAGNLKPTARIYEVRLAVSGSLPTDIITLGSAYLKIT